jgi:uncharacterized protein YggE
MVGRVSLLFLLLSFSRVCFAQERSITVTGEATVHATPDRAMVVMGVSSMDSIVAKVLSEARGLGIEDADIQTEFVSLQPHDSYGVTSHLDGYTMTKDITIRVKDMKNFDGFLSRLLTAGASTINSVQYQSSTARQLQVRAEGDAVIDARSHADELAKDLGLKLGNALRVTETRSEVRTMRNNMNTQSDITIDIPGETVTALGQLAIKTTLSVQYSVY